MSKALLKAMRKRVLISALVVSTAAFLVPTLASAAVITIGIQQDGVGPITQATDGTDSFSLLNPVSTADFTVTKQTGGTTQNTLPSPGLLFSNNISVTSTGFTGSHFLDVYVTATGLTGPLGNPLGILSGLTNNALTSPTITTTLTTFLSSGNILFGGTQLTSATLAPNTTVFSSDLANTGAGPYSVTALFHFVATGAGGANATIAIAAVPGPIVGAGLPGLIAACGGLLALARRRRQKLA